MPSHDYASRRASEELLKLAREPAAARALVARIKKDRDRKRDDGGEPVPVEPDRPNTLSGGAAAALEFDD